jgi:hypothetical protein
MSPLGREVRNRPEDLGRRRSVLPNPVRQGTKAGDNRGECIWFGSLYVRILSLWTPVDSEDAASWRFAVAGAALAGGLVFGFVLSSLFRWSPYYWQWLAYHNGLVAAVITYLLVWASDERPRRRKIRRLGSGVRILGVEAADVESTL